MIRVYYLTLYVGILGFLCTVCDGAIVAPCDNTQAVQCGQTAARQALASGCQYSTVVPLFAECVRNQTSGCDSAQRDQWTDYINTINESLVNQLCYNVCNDETRIEASVEKCEALYGGLATLAAEIISTQARPTDTSCSIALRRVRVCMLNATLSCPTLQRAAIQTINDHIVAFTQCDQTLPDVPIINGDGNDTITDPIKKDPPADTTNLALYIALGLSGFVILITGIMILVVWIQGQRNANYKKGDNSPNVKTSDRTDHMGRPGGPYYTRDRSPRRYKDDDDASEYSMGPYRPSGRWWTRPGFGTYGPEVRPARPF